SKSLFVATQGSSNKPAGLPLYLFHMDLDLRENVPLAPLTTLGVGGSARFFVRAESEHGMQEAIHFAGANKLPLFVLGGGSDLVVSDHGWDGLVLQIGIPGIDQEGE